MLGGDACVGPEGRERQRVRSIHLSYTPSGWPRSCTIEGPYSSYGPPEVGYGQFEIKNPHSPKGFFGADQSCT